MASTNLKQEYMKTRRNLQNRMSYYRRKGYQVPDDYVPSIPKRITQGSIRNLQRLASRLKDVIEYVTEFGEILKGKYAKVAKQREKRKERAKRERQERRQKIREPEEYVEPEELEQDYDFYEDNTVEQEVYDDNYIDNFLDQFYGSAFGEVLSKSIIKLLEGQVSRADIARGLKELENTDYAPSSSVRYDLDSAIQEVQGFISNFVLLDDSDRYDLREAFSDDEMLQMGMEFERNRSDYRNHQRAVRYANRKK